MIQFAEKAEPTLLVISIAEEFGEGGSSSELFAIPVLSRANGFLVCIPRGGFSEELLVDAMANSEGETVLGPSKGITVNLVEEADDGSLVPTGSTCNCLLLDLSDAALSWIREYDPTAEEVSIIGFSSEHPTSLPMRSEVVLNANEWISTLGVERANFYSAQEDPEPKASPKDVIRSKAAAPKRVTNVQVMELLTTLSNQVKVLASRQDSFEKAGIGPVMDVGGQQLGSTANVPAVSAGLPKEASVMPPFSPFAKAVNVVGPPPRVRGQGSMLVPTPLVQPGAQDPSQLQDPSIAQALSQQSAAVTALVAHLASQADPLSELQGGGNLSSSTKGVQRRERMQQDLASGSSSYYLQMMQQVHKRMCPSRPLPKSEAELSHLSFLSYLEKTGGYKGAKESGLLMWLLGYVIDAAAQDDMHQVKERLALVVTALEQSVVDGGDWSVAYLLSLAEDPPLSLYQEKSAIVSPYGRPFSSLVPSQWAAVILAYVKELEVLTTKKQEASPKKTITKAVDPDAPPSPKRRTRFPRKPKADPPPKA